MSDWHLRKRSAQTGCVRKLRCSRYFEGVAKPVITATELARNTRDILDRVAAGGETITIERNHALIAQIMPPQ